MRGYLIVPGGFLCVEVRNCDKAGRGGIAVAALHCASAGNQVEAELQLGKRSSAIGGRCADGAGGYAGLLFQPGGYGFCGSVPVA